MIPIQRGPEPAALTDVRARELPRLRAIAASRAVSGEDVTGYQVAAEPLWEAQHHKCCYCEQRIKLWRNDVEHYRPKGHADRSPGCADTHGYWWLAFHWRNLLFSCPSCNQHAKRCRFPLMRRDTALTAEQPPPGGERPLLIDPAAGIHPARHIQFEHRLATTDDARRFRGSLQWFARPRNRSARGIWTIDVCGLNDPDLIELRRDHVDTVVRPQAVALNAALLDEDEPRIRRELYRASGMFRPRSEYVVLTYDALRHLLPNERLAPWKIAWPEPHEIGLPAT